MDYLTTQELQEMYDAVPAMDEMEADQADQELYDSFTDEERKAFYGAW